MSDTFNTTVTNWQGVDKELIYESRNLVENKDVYSNIANVLKRITIPVNYSIADYNIQTNGKFGTNNNYKHGVVTVSEGEIYVFSNDAESLDSQRFALAISDSYGEDSNIDLVQGTEVTTIYHKTTYIIEIPSGCNYLLFNALGSLGYIFTISKVIKLNDLTDNEKTALRKCIGFGDGNIDIETIGGSGNVVTSSGAFNIREDLSYKVVADELATYSLQLTGKFGINDIYSHAVLAVNPGEKYIIRNKSLTMPNTRYAFATSDEVEAGGDIPLVEETSVVMVPASRSVCVTIPAGCNYLLINIGGDYPFSVSRFPTKIIETEKELNDKIEGKLLLIVGSSETGSKAGVTEIGDVYFRTTQNDLRKAVKANSGGSDFVYETIPFYKNAIYRMGNELYIWDDVNTQFVKLYNNFVPSVFTHILNGEGSTFVSTRDREPKMKLKVGVAYRVVIEYLSNMQITSQAAFAIYKVYNDVRTTVALWDTETNGPVPLFFDFVAEENDYYYIGARSAKDSKVSATFFNLEGLSEESSISALTLNPKHDIFQKLVIANKKYYTNDPNDNPIDPLVLAHISDVHGASDQYRRFIEFAEYWKNKGYINELIDTGDIVYNDFQDGVDWRNNIEGVEKVITVVGNHDTRASNGEKTDISYPQGQNEWQYHSVISLDSSKRKDAYNMLMVGPNSNSPYINNWDVIQPENAEDIGYCYYYKDYVSRNLRMIALDVMGYDETQDNWLEDRLAEARTLGYHVVILAHFCGEIMTGLECNYTSLFPTGSDRNIIDSYNNYAYHIPEKIDDFQSSGGVFVGYITGHYHRDMVNIITGYPKQLVCSVSSGGRDRIRDTTKVVGCKSYDDFQIVSINTYDKTIRLIKIGADIDYYMRKKGTVCIGYTLVKDDGTEPVTGETATKVKGIIGEGW